MTSTSRFVRICSAVLLGLPVVLDLSPAMCTEFEGQMMFGVDVDFAPPLATPFMGTFTFNNESPDFYLNDRYRLPFTSLIITGGDSGEGGTYVINPIPVLPSIHYLLDGTFLTISVSLRNEVLNRSITMSFDYPDPPGGEFWIHHQHFPFPGGTVGLRRGPITFTAPTLPPVPEPGAVFIAAVGVTVLSLRSRYKGPRTISNNFAKNLRRGEPG